MEIVLGISYPKYETITISYSNPDEMNKENHFRISGFGVAGKPQNPKRCFPYCFNEDSH